MAGGAITIGVDDAEVQAAIAKLAHGIGKSTWDEIGGMVETSTKQRFEEQRGPDGTPWAPLAPSTVAGMLTRGRARGSAHILRQKMHLYRSITHTATDREAIIGSNRRYAALHQFGGTAGMKNAGARAVPARPFLGLSRADLDEVVRILAAQIGGSEA